MVGALAYWGVQTGDGAAGKVLLGIAAPAVGFGIWGAVDFHWAGRYAEPLRLAEELVISGLAAAALAVAGQPALGIGLAALSVVHHALVYALGDRLLEPRPAGARRAGAATSGWPSVGGRRPRPGGRAVGGLVAGPAGQGGVEGGEEPVEGAVDLPRHAEPAGGLEGDEAVQRRRAATGWRPRRRRR